MDTNPYRSPTSRETNHQGSVKVKTYGLLPLTQNAYLAIQVVLIVTVVGFLFGVRSFAAIPGQPFGFVDDYFWIIVGTIIGLEAVETAVMLTKFKKARQTRREQTPNE